MQTLVVSADEQHRSLLRACARPDTIVVATPLDVIAQLERDDPHIGTVVLVGSLAASPELATFLREFYPGVEIVDGRDDVRFLPALA
jgi:hypothetical protein